MFSTWFSRYSVLVMLALVALAIAGTAQSWVGPTAPAPGGNVPAPINSGSDDQVKSAALGVDGLAVFGNSILGTSSYLNWGTTPGSTGYGIRDSLGTLEFKNVGGSWQSLQTVVNTYISLSGGASGVWNTNGAKYYYSGGAVGIWTTNPAYALDVASGARIQGDFYLTGIAAASTGYYACVEANGQVTRGGSCALSDARLKKDVAPLKASLEKVSRLSGVSFTWIDAERAKDGTQLGLIAQDVEKEFPEAVITNSDGLKAVNYDALVGPLVEAIKELRIDNQRLRERIEVLESR